MIPIAALILGAGFVVLLATILAIVKVVSSRRSYADELRTTRDAPPERRTISGGPM